VPTDAPPVSSSFRHRDLAVLFAVTFLAYANISIFFRFYAFLHTLPVDPKQYGWLIGVFSAVSLIFRPLVSPFFHPGNAHRYIRIGAVAAMVSLSAYSLAGGFWSLLLVRSLHGLAFVILGAALMALIVGCIPENRSAQAFGLLSIVILIPNTLIPPVLQYLETALGGFTHILLLFAGITALVFPLVAVFSPSSGSAESGPAHRGLGAVEVLSVLKDVRILLLMGAMLLLYSSHALVFFFLDGYGRHIGISDTGFFLTLATAGEIGVRLAAGNRFDRTNKIHTAAAAMIGLALGFVLLAQARSPMVFFSLGAVVGIGWGIAMPVFNGLVFDLSEPRFRPFNTNLGLQMFQAGFFIGPTIGGYVVAHGGYPVLFIVCAASSLLAAGLTISLKSHTP